MTFDLGDNEFNIFEEDEVFVFPTSFAQQRLWFLDQLVPGNPFYNVATAIRLTGSLNLSALEQTFNEIVRRHEALRTKFVMVEGEPMQVITPTLTIPLPVIDLCHLPTTERQTKIEQLAIHEAKRPFDLTTGPLLRVTLLKLDAAEYVLLLNLHHIVADGWSIGVLIRELGTLYKAFVEEKPSPLPPPPIQYADFAEWQREWLQGDVLQTQLDYWRQQLDGISMVNLPTDRPRPPVPTYRGAKQFLELSPSLSQALDALSSEQGVTLFITLLAAFQTLLYRYTQQEDIAIGSAIANRNRSEIEGIIGFFVNSLVLRTNLGGNPTFLELLSRVKEVAIASWSHQDLPFEKLVEELHPERDISRNPLFQISFSLQNTPIEALELPGLTLSLLEFDIGTAKLDLELHLWEDVESIKGQIVYSTDLFDDATITRMLGHFQTLLAGIVANPEQRICELPILSEAEREQLLIAFNQNQRDLRIRPPSPPNLGETRSTPPKVGGLGGQNDSVCVSPAQSKIQNPKSKIEQCIHQLFEVQVEKTPDAIALIFEDKQLTYRELNIRANQLAHHLHKLGVFPDVIVGICLDRSIEMIVGLLAILKAGGAYLPLDPNYPQERLHLMLEDAKVTIVLTQQKFVERLTSDSLSIVCLDKEWQTIAQYSQENPNISVIPENLAYVIYTSGSTGKPKGVLLQHRGLCNLAQAQIEVFNLHPNNRVLQFASLSFDASIFEIVMALLTGATLCLAKKECILPGQSLIELLRDRAITHVTLPPAVLAVLPTDVETSLPALRTIIAAGESCSKDIVKRWLLPNLKFFNAYGPTEATVWSTVAEISDDSEKPSIGSPITNTQVYILDRHLQPVPIGIPGELYISGEGIGRGYLNRPDLTAEKFIPHPFSNKPGERIYKTGDLACYRPDGNIEFLGRIDDQVKIRGFRIELGEIETALKQHPGVGEAVAIATEDASGNKRLIAYILPKEQFINSKSDIWRQFLKEKLPEYMVPSAFVMLDSLPLTPSGKVDRLKLSIPANINSISIDKSFVAPRTPTESKLTKIWAEILNLERVSINDNFFDLGGDSILAIRLMDQIHNQFNLSLPLSKLFLHPTVAGLANTLSPETDSLPWSPLVAIQPNGSNSPFFCVHPIFGVVFPYYELAQHLGKNQPFYALQPLGIDGEKPPLTRIEDMASYYIEALQVIQPRGPYFLGGWSFGGLVAFEMAQQLQDAGHEVALLALLDTLAPVSSNKPSFWNGLKFLFATAGRYVWPFLLDYLYLINASSKDQSDILVTKFSKLNKIKKLLPTNFSWDFILGQATLTNLMPQEARGRILNELTIRPLLRVFQANTQATVSYVPKTYSSLITLFRSSDQLGKAHQDATLGWSQLAREKVEVHRIPGNHLTLLRKPHVQVLTEKLKICLEKTKAIE